MAKQKGIIFFEGTLGGINFYYRKGVPTARAAGGGFTKKAIKKGANMVRVRESNTEFAGCSRVNKFFKHSIHSFLLGYKDGTLHSRLMQMFLKIKECDVVSARGKRTVSLGVSTAIGKHILKDFTFTLKRPNLLFSTYGFEWETLTFSVTGFNVDLERFPKGASYVELLFGVVRFDFKTNSYFEVSATPLIIERDFTGDSFSVAITELPEGTGVLFAIARVAFYQRVNTVGYMLPGNGAFGLEIVSVEGA